MICPLCKEKLSGRNDVSTCRKECTYVSYPGTDDLFIEIQIEDESIVYRHNSIKIYHQFEFEPYPIVEEFQYSRSTCLQELLNALAEKLTKYVQLLHFA